MMENTITPALWKAEAEYYKFKPNLVSLSLDLERPCIKKYQSVSCSSVQGPGSNPHY